MVYELGFPGLPVCDGGCGCQGPPGSSGCDPNGGHGSVAPFAESGYFSVITQGLFLLTLICVYYFIHRVTGWNSGSLLKYYSMYWSGLCLPGVGVYWLSSDTSVG